MFHDISRTIWKPLWANRWLFMDGNSREVLFPDGGKILRISLSNLVYNACVLFKERYRFDIDLRSRAPVILIINAATQR